MKTRLLPIALAAIFGTSASQAELLIDEPFLYGSGPTHDVPVSDDATGLTGSWVVGGHSGGTNPSVNFLFNSLEFENHFFSDGGALELRNAGGGNWGPLGAAIPLDPSLDLGSHSVLWTSAVIRVASPDANYYPDWRVEYRLNTAANSPLETSALRIMGRNENSVSTAPSSITRSRAAVGADHTVASEPPPPDLGSIEAGVNYLFVTRSTVDTGTKAITAITLYVFDEAAYGSYLVAAAAPTADAEALLATHATLILTDDNVSSGTNTLANKTVLQFSINGGPVGAFDTIRLGTELTDVVNLDAEPYFELALDSATIGFTGATIVIADVETAMVDDSDPEAFFVEVNGEVVADFQLAKADGKTTITIPIDDIQPNTTYVFYMEIPRTDGEIGYFQPILTSYRIPLDLPGPPGSAGRWGIREYANPVPHEEEPNPNPVANSIAAATQHIIDAGDEHYVENGDVPVLNHSDPDTNNPATKGNFNNDFPILSNTPGNDGWVVIGKTQLSIPAAGVYTFAVHSDDGFGLRVSGGAGGRFLSVHGSGSIDQGDNQSILLDGPTGDANTRGVYQFDGAGTYDVTYIGWDGGGGGYYELAWAPGSFPAARDTNTWTLVGSPSDPTVTAIPFQPRFITNIPGPPATAGNFSIRTYLQATGTGNINDANNFVLNTTRQPGDPDGLTHDIHRPTLNANDPQDGGGGGAVTPDEPFPGNTGGADDNVITVAKGRIVIPVTRTYTFWVQSDDGFMLRIKGADGTPNPVFQRVTQGSNANPGTFQMSNPHEMFFDAGTGNADTRGIIELQAGSYDIDFLHWEGGAGFYYELTSAEGAWPHGSGTPPDGWLLVGYASPVDQLEFPGIAEPGWTVESSLPNRPEDAALGFSIAGAEARINATLALDPRPAGAVTTWDRLDFFDPQNGSQGSFPNSIPWPLDTDADDHNYAMRATGALVITDPGFYHLGFQGDDGGYMQIDGPLEGGAPVTWSHIAAQNHPESAIVTGDTGHLNRLQLQLGTGNSRTIGAIELSAGTYTVKTLVYEGTGGSWWEVVGAKASPSTNIAYPLLVKGSGGIVHYPSGIQLIERPEVTPPDDGDFRITDPAFTVGEDGVIGSVSFSFGSQDGATYTVEASTDLVDWTILDGNVAATGESTAVNIDLSAFEELYGETKVFFRVRLNE